MKIGSIDASSIAISHDGTGTINGLPFRVSATPHATYRADPDRPWTVKSDALDAQTTAALEQWCRAEVGQLYLNGVHGCCPTRRVP